MGLGYAISLARRRWSGIGSQKVSGEGTHLGSATYLLIQLWQLNDVHIVVQLKDLFKVLSLDAMTRLTHAAVRRQ